MVCHVDPVVELVLLSVLISLIHFIGRIQIRPLAFINLPIPEHVVLKHTKALLVIEFSFVFVNYI